MKTRSKIGNKLGNPAYRTPSVFRYGKDLTVVRNKSKLNQLSIIAGKNKKSQFI